MNLTAKEIAFLSPSFTQTTPLSLFSNIKVETDGTEYDKLVQKGIIKNGGYDPQALEILLQIASPKRCARLVTKNAFFILEKYTYWNDGKLVLAENKGGEFVFSKITDFHDLSIGLSEIFSMSSIKTTEVSIVLPDEEMMVLLAVMDIYRKNTLMDYSGDIKPVQSVSLKEIQEEAAKGFKNGLVKILTNNYTYRMPEQKDIPVLLEKLAAKKCLTMDNGYRLTTDYELLAKNFLIPDTVVQYDALEVMPNGDVPLDGGLSVTAGIHDIITFAFTKDTIGLYSFSAFQMLTAIEKTLSCPKLMEEEKEIPPPPVQTAPPPPVQTAPAPAPIQAAPVPLQTASPQPAQPVPAASAPAGTWQCSCGRVNKGNFCAGCGKHRA
jgi:hypothetical protein